MASLAFGALGSVLGSAIGIGGSIGWLVGSAIGSYLFAPTQTIEGPRLSDLSVTSSTYGRPIPVLYGTSRMAGNIIWSTGLEEVKVVEETGGKGGGGETEVITYEYYSTFALALCEGPISDVTRMWADGKLLYDKSADNDDGDWRAAVEEKTGVEIYTPYWITELGLNFRVYYGTEDQEPDGLILADKGVENTPAYKGLAYIVFDRLALADYGNRIPNITVEVTTNATPALVYSEIDTIASAEGGIIADDSFQSDGVAIDYVREKFYVAAVDAGKYYIRVFNSRTMREERQAVIEFDGNQTAVNNLDIMLASENGYIIANTSLGNSRVISIINPDTLLVQNSFGVSGASTSVSPNGAGALNANACAVTKVITPTDVLHFAILGTIRDGIVVLNISGGGAGYVWDSDSDPAKPTPALDSNLRVLGVCASSPAEYEIELSAASAFIFAGPNYDVGAQSGDVNLYEIQIGADGGFESDTQAYTGVNLVHIATYAPSDLVTDATTLSQVGLPIYNMIDDTVLLHVSNGDDHYVVKINKDTGAVAWASQVPFGRTTAPGFSQSKQLDDLYSVVSNKASYTINTITGEVVDEQTEWPVRSSATGFAVWDTLSASILAAGNSASSAYRFFFRRVQTGGAGLDVIVADLCDKSGLEAADISVTDLSTEVVEGYVLTREMTARDAIQPLTNVHFFDGVESDYILKFSLRDGKTPEANIPQRDLALLDEDGDYLQETRIQEVELPTRLTFKYADVENDHQPSAHNAKRPLRPLPVMNSRNEITFDIAASMTPDFAKQAAEKALYSAWIERSSYSFRLPWKYTALDAADVVTITMDDGAVFRTRLVQTDIGVDYTLAMSGLSESAAQYTSTVAADGGDSGLINAYMQGTQTKLIMLNSPLLVDAHDSARASSAQYYFVGGYGQFGWTAGTVYKSTDGINYEVVGAVTQEMIWGSAVNALPPPPEGQLFSTDEVNTLTVFLNTGIDRLVSVTQRQMVDGANMFALIRQDGQPEILQYRDVTNNADGSYTLSGLLRGRRGSDAFVTGHLSGDIFVFLDTKSGGIAPLTLDEQDLTRFYRGVTSGTLFETAQTISNASPFNDLKPYAPVNARISSGSWGSDATIIWDRRTRIGGGLKDTLGDVPLNEDSEKYDLEICDGFDQVLRTQNGLTSASYTYTAADQSTDFPGGWVNATSAGENMSFEAGTTSAGSRITGWTLGTGASALRVVTSSGLITAAQNGSNFLSMASSGETAVSIRQDISVAGFAKQIDDASVQFRVGGYVAAFEASTDTARIDIIWLDYKGDVLSTATGTETNPADDGSWTQITETVTAPLGARTMRIVLHGTRVSGTETVVAWDNITIEYNEGTKSHLNVLMYQVSAQAGRGFAGRGQIGV